MTQKLTMTSFRLPTDLYVEFKQWAADNERSVTKQVIIAMRESLANRPHTVPPTPVKSPQMPRTTVEDRITQTLRPQPSPSPVVSGTRYTVTVTDAESDEILDTATFYQEIDAVDAAEREAERLAEVIAERLYDHAPEDCETYARFERETWGRYLIMGATGDGPEGVAAIITITETEDAA